MPTRMLESIAATYFSNFQCDCVPTRLFPLRLRFFVTVYFCPGIDYPVPISLSGRQPEL